VRLLNFSAAGERSFGILTTDGVIDLGTRLLGQDYTDVDDLIRGEALDKAARIAERASPDHALGDIILHKPVTAPEKIFCVGVNYADRNEEYRDASELPKYPSLFMRTAGSFAAHGEALMQPRESQLLDYEGEIAVVIGRTGRRIPQQDAMHYIAGFTCCNEGSVRDWTRHGKFNVTQGKNFERSGALGPYLVTPDELGDAPLRVRTHVNGELRQDDVTDRMRFPIPYLLHYISTFSELHPGDIIVTGTPAGSGASFDPPRYLKPSDVVEVDVSSVGTLRNTVAAES
jgi:2-keto-4-pentenoate hydratase/2-oxohepta-3-ene-1,7-dioic acid hydratase in catechol pathway